MTIGLLTIDLLIPGTRSLKDKRRVVKSIKKRMRNKFNCSVAEVDYHDEWRRARMAVCVVSGDATFANKQLNEIAKFASLSRDAEVISIHMEML